MNYWFQIVLSDATLTVVKTLFKGPQVINYTVQVNIGQHLIIFMAANDKSWLKLILLKF
jgi:hypothetical protein